MAVVKHESESDASAKDVYKRKFKGADGLKYTWLDADSLDDGSEQTLRIKGFNAAETNKIIDRNGEIRFVQGQLGAKEQTEAAARIAEAGGFNIKYPDYSHYKDSNTMLTEIIKQNAAILAYGKINNCKWEYFTSSWISENFGVEIPVTKVWPDILVTLIK